MLKISKGEWIFFSSFALIVIVVGLSAHYFGRDTYVAGKALGYPIGLLPDPKYTIGVPTTLNLADITKLYNGQTYSQAHRNVTQAEKNQVYAEYGLSYPQPQGAIEVDHFYPMCAGASNDIKNLWAEPAHVMWNGQDYGFHTKDKLETYVCAQIKAGKIDPKVAFQKITTDWPAYYHELGLDKVNNLGAVIDLDGDDQ